MYNFGQNQVIWLVQGGLIDIPDRILNSEVKKIDIEKLDFTLLPKLVAYKPKYFVIICNTDSSRLLYFLKLLLCALSVPVFVFVKKYLGSLDFIKFLQCQLVSIFELKNLNYRRILRLIGRKLAPAEGKSENKLYPKIFLNNYLKVIVIGASAGGPGVVHKIIKEMPVTSPPVLIAQHMPTNFTGVFIRNLSRSTLMNVKLPEQNEVLRPGTIYVVPSDKNLVVVNKGGVLRVNLVEPNERFKYKPSIDLLFASVANSVGRQSLGIILSGIGDDGVRGLKMMKIKGGVTIAQDPSSAAVFGMPKEAINEKAAKLVLTAEEIAIFVKYLLKCKN